MVYSQTENNFAQCPKTFDISNFLSERGKPAIIEFSIKENGQNLKYFWNVDKGEIVAGQGTSKIKVSTEGLGYLMPVSVKIEGLPESCPSEISFEIVIPHEEYQPILFYYYEKISFEEEVRKFEEFYKELIKVESDLGFILLKSDTAEDLLARLKNLNDLSLSKNYDRSRLIIFITDDESELSKMYFISGEMLDCENCKKITLATYVQDVQNLIDKKNSEETEESKDNK